MSLVGIFGGTFDPIHLGHTRCVAEVSKTLGLNKVLFIPSARPPHRDKPCASSEQRLAMVKLALAQYPQFECDDRELKRNKPSYTIDTLASIHAQGQHSLCLILGLDAFLELENWHRWQELFELTHFVVMQRPGSQNPSKRPAWWQAAEIDDAGKLEQRTHGAIYMIPVTPMAVSASAIRRRIKCGEDPSNDLHDSVWDYIRRNRLYSV